jgi:hypothetical protein
MIIGGKNSQLKGGKQERISSMGLKQPSFNPFLTLISALRYADASLLI